MIRFIFAFLLLAALPVYGQMPTSAPSSPTGRILCQYWRGQSGNRVGDLLASPAYPQFPTEQVELEQLEIPEQDEGEFGTIIRGWLHPPQSGDYTFRIAGDNQCELWLSTDDAPARLRLLASVPDWSGPRQWDRHPKQRSAPLRLESGQRYAIEVRHKDGGGASSLAVAWTLPDGTLEEPIPGSCLSPAARTEVPAAEVRKSPEELPRSPGNHRVEVEVDALGQRVIVPLILTIPHGQVERYPVLVFLPDAQSDAGEDGSRIHGPSRELAGTGALAEWSPFIVLAPQASPDFEWDGVVYPRAVAAAIDHLLSRLPIDQRAVFLTGGGSGGFDLWRMLVHLRSRPAAVSTICGGDVQEPELLSRLEGVKVWIITGTRHGMSTEHSNRMARFLSVIQPPVRIDYDNDRGLDVIDYQYAQKSFYEQLLAWRGVGPPLPNPGLSGTRIWMGIVLGVVTAIALVVGRARATRRRRCSPT